MSSKESVVEGPIFLTVKKVRGKPFMRELKENIQKLKSENIYENQWTDSEYYSDSGNILYVENDYLYCSDGKHAGLTYWPKVIPPLDTKSELLFRFWLFKCPNVATAMSLFKNGPTLKSRWISIEEILNSCSSVSSTSMLWSPTLCFQLKCVMLEYWLFQVME